MDMSLRSSRDCGSISGIGAPAGAKVYADIQGNTRNCSERFEGRLVTFSTAGKMDHTLVIAVYSAVMKFTFAV